VEANNLAAQRITLTKAIKETLKSFKKLGAKVTEDTIEIKGRKFTLSIDLVRGKGRMYDEGPEEEYENWLVYWRDSQGHANGGCSSVESFNQSFGQHMSMYL
jgi:hypothetical protein